MHNSSIRLPAEWEPQDAILLAWPHDATDWQPLLEEITAVFVELTRRITLYESVIIVAPETAAIQSRLTAAGVDPAKVHLARVPTNDTWARDFGPLTVLRNGRPLLLDFGFNGWGLKFAADRDNLVTGRLHAAAGFGATPRQIVGLILEGGSIESDGAGTILTTSACLLSGNRNPHLSRHQVEQALAEHLGAQQVLWLDHGYLAGDDTDSHIDTLARLCPDGTILYVRCDDSADEHYAELQKMEQQLRQLRSLAGKPYRLLPLPWPQAVFDENGGRLPATYANFLVLNDAVLVPTYADQADAAALTVIAEAFPSREIIGLDCRPVIWQHGSLHCITMQIPEGVLS